MSRCRPAILSATLALAILFPSSLTAPGNCAESQYVWSAAYFGSRLAHLDFSTEPGPDSMTDPSWNPATFWTLTQPMGTRFLYAAAMGLFQLPVPSLPYDWDQRDLPQSEAIVPPITLRALRALAILCAALGFALLALRFGWPTTLATALLLAIPHVRYDLVCAWAEGPLILGFGLCSLAYGTRKFALACALAASFKLTGLAMWPLMLVPGAFGAGIGPRWSLLAPVVWSLLSPPSWFALGPVYLVIQVLDRSREYILATLHPGPAGNLGPGGLYIATRYLWLLEWLLLLAVARLTQDQFERHPGIRPPHHTDGQG